MKFAITTLGCKVNAYESDSYVVSLTQAGFREVTFTEIADIYIINTCAVTNTAAAKSRQKINQAKKLNEKALICVVGCYVQVDYLQLQKDLGIDVLIGADNKSTLVTRIMSALKGKKQTTITPSVRSLSFDQLISPTFKKQSRAYLKIQDGCNQYCSYCIIPYARGVERSLEASVIIEEAKKLIASGHQELVLTGIHTGRYRSTDCPDLVSLIKLLLLELPDLRRLRISSIESTEITEELISLLKNEDRLAKHLHIPLQSATDEILTLMNRPYTVKEYQETLKQVREAIPNIAISTDIIVGFPSESAELFEESYRNISSMNFSFLHVFPFSLRKGTKAEEIPNHLDNSIKKERVKELMSLSKEQANNYMSKFIGKTVEVLVETNVNGYYKGYCSEYFEVHFKSEKDLHHQLVFVTIRSVDENFCYGELKRDSDVIK